MDPATIALILGYGLKYGPEVATMIIGLFKKTTVTVDDVEALFAQIKPYAAYGIPDKAPTISA